MSGGQKPRTPEYFPRMKYRARKRKYQQDWYSVCTVIDWTAITRGFENAVVSFREFAEGLRAAREDWHVIGGDLAVAVERMRRDLGKRHELADVAAELGIDLDEEAA